MTMTFGQLVEKQQSATPSSDVVSAAAYEIPFGKHKGMTLMKLIEQQHSYCMWLINQEESKNKNFNETCENIKILLAIDQTEFIDDDGTTNMKPYVAKAFEQISKDKVLKVDGVELVAGESVVIAVDPAKEEPTPIGIKTKLPDGLLMGKVSELLEKIDAEGLIFYFDHEDEMRWVTLVKEFQHGTDSFVGIQTKTGLGNPQSIKKMISLKELKKRQGVIQNA